MKTSRSRKSSTLYDPSELEELIHNPAVGRGVGSHLFRPAALPAPAPPAPSHLSTVVNFNLTTVDTFNLSPVPADAIASAASLLQSCRFWQTEAGEMVPRARIRLIQSIDDVMSDAEKVAHQALCAHTTPAPQGDYLCEIGYELLCRQTGLSRKTVQRVVDKLVEKDLVAIQRPADIYTRRPTLYRVFSPAEALARMVRRNRLFVAKIGPGFVYAQPAGNLPQSERPET
ncbi:hypothetical protein [Paludibaculum fermentans]|uniref:hypothetical protein n=1 Tax=Paludibaculum fermentans TaxID=1473598 RepID=UPI003EB720FF